MTAPLRTIGGTPRRRPRRGLSLRGRSLLLRIVQLPLPAHGRSASGARDPRRLLAHRVRRGRPARRSPPAVTSWRSCRPPSTSRELRDRLSTADAAAIIKVGRHLAKVRGVIESLRSLGGRALRGACDDARASAACRSAEVDGDEGALLLHDPRAPAGVRVAMSAKAGAGVGTGVSAGLGAAVGARVAVVALTASGGGLARSIASHPR